jgi:hypothetical protein
MEAGSSRLRFQNRLMRDCGDDGLARPDRRVPLPGGGWRGMRCARCSQ